MKNVVTLLRLITIIEAVSYLVLLAVAMPLKYVWHLPIAVQITGPIHGVLFLIFAYALCQTYLLARWPFTRALVLFAASFVPVVPFFFDSQLRAWAEEYDRRKYDR